MKIIIAIVIFSAIILFHELGHFLFAKLNKIVVTEFSLGMGPRLYSFEKGDTRYSLKLLPIGGSCAMLGEDTDIENEPGTFNSASVWGRISVVAAGPVFNFIMAFVLSVIIVGAVGYEPSRVLSVKEGSAAEAAGLKEGDIITGYQGYHIDLGKDLYVYSYLNQLKEGDTINLTVKRDGKKMDISYKSDTNVRYLLGCNFNGDDTSAMTVESVMDGMPLQEAGIQQGDVITSINGVKITNAADYQKYIQENPLTEKSVKITYSSAGNGRRFITPRFAESRTARLSIFIHRIMVPSLLLSSYVVPIASTIPTGPLRSFIPSFPLTSSFRLRIVVRTIYFTSTAPYLTIFSPFAFSEYIL